MGLLNYQNFWDDPEKGELLASFIVPYVSDSSGFKDRRVDADGDIIMPGRILARAGPDRVTRRDAKISLNAQASLFAETYSWEVVSKPVGARVKLTNSSSMKAIFSADRDGDYRVRLTASTSGGGSKSDTLKIKVDNGLAIAPRELSFIDDIGPYMAAPTNCNSCHVNGGEAGIPVWWDADGNQPVAPPTTKADPPALGFYEQVLARVNLEVIEDSLLLKKPSGNHHFGDQRTGFDTSLSVGAAGRANYDMFVNWIAEGATCGRVGAAPTVECVR